MHLIYHNKINNIIKTVTKAKIKGVTLILAMIILTIIALASQFLLSLTTKQAANTKILIQGTRAMFAAKSGLSWGLVMVNKQANCFSPAKLYLADPGLQGFQVEVLCNTPEPNKFIITATAIYGAFGTADYVIRTVNGGFLKNN